MPHNSDRFNKSKFVQIIGKNVFKFYGQHLKEIRSKNLSISKLDSYGTDRQIHLKAIFNDLNLIRQYFDDLNIFSKFFNIDRKKISKLYGKALSDEDYYKYHYDNFVIRLLTSIDLCGKIGCTAYRLKIKNDSWYQFSQNKLIKGTKIEEILISYSDYIDKLRQHRHEKVHTGKSKDNQFDKIIFWDSLMDLLDEKLDEDVLSTLNEITDDDIKLRIYEMESVLTKCIDFTYDFLDTLVTKAKTIVDNE